MRKDSGLVVKGTGLPRLENRGYNEGHVPLIMHLWQCGWARINSTEAVKYTRWALHNKELRAAAHQSLQQSYEIQNLSMHKHTR